MLRRNKKRIVITPSNDFDMESAGQLQKWLASQLKFGNSFTKQSAANYLLVSDTRKKGLHSLIANNSEVLITECENQNL